MRLNNSPSFRIGAALTIARCVLVFMGAMLFVILSPYRIEAEGAGVFAILIGIDAAMFASTRGRQRDGG